MAYPYFFCLFAAIDCICCLEITRCGVGMLQRGFDSPQEHDGLTIAEIPDIGVNGPEQFEIVQDQAVQSVDTVESEWFAGKRPPSANTHNTINAQVSRS